MLRKNVYLLYMFAVLVCSMPRLTVASATASEETKNFSRLFTTAKQRSRLDQSRKRYLLGLDRDQPLEESINSVNLREITYGGVVMRADGDHQIWINGVDVSKNKDSRFQAEVLADRSVRVTVADDQTIRLYPGQVYRFEDGLIQEGYQVAKDLLEEFVEEEPEALETDEDEKLASEEKTPIEFDEAELTKQITRIRLLEDRIEELEKRRKAKLAE